MKKVFIDGKAGTTGLRIAERLAMRDDVEIISLSDNLRKDYEARKKIINEADIVFLCLPDAAAIEAVQMVENENTVVIDASTAHRTNPIGHTDSLSLALTLKIKSGKAKGSQCPVAMRVALSPLYIH